MSFVPGTRLGLYEIVSPLGAGGMGEVYRARDTRLDRIVALKVLLSSTAGDLQLRERFEREARAISSLNHPNICILHDVGRERPSNPASAAEEPPIDFLVMEYLEGETLASRLERGPLPLAQAIDVAIQIAGALDRAHREGIVHRDIKPGNVMLAKAPTAASGRSGVHVKLLDFGLARLVKPGPHASEAAGDSPASGVTLAELTTAAHSSHLTMRGTVLGTLQYMAPEQLQGKVVDARADIFALGALLYETIAGRRPFEGKSQAAVIGAILDHEPPSVASVQPATPPLLAEIITRCLAKDPDDRWQSSRDLLRQLEWIAANPAGAPAAPGEQAKRISDRNRIVRTGVVALTVAALSGGIVAWSLWPRAPAPVLVSRFTVELPAGDAFTRTGRRVVALSSDGSQLVYVANRQLYRRHVNDLATAAIPGTVNSDPSEPVFSPDGEWIAFWSAGAIWKIPSIGGAPIQLSPADNPTGMSWHGDRILVGQAQAGIIEVPPDGGDPITIVNLDRAKEEQAQSPHLLAGGRAVLFTLRTGNQGWDDASIVVEDLTSHRRTVIVRGGTDARLTPTGHLIYAREGTLLAAAFDEDTLAVRGLAKAVQAGVEIATAGFSGTAQAALSTSGTLAFVPGTFSSQNRLAWVDRQGRLEETRLPHRRYQTGSSQMRLSPDGTRVALTLLADVGAGQPGAGQDVWVWDLARDALTRLSFTSGGAFPVWTPDSRRVCFVSGSEVLCQGTDGAGQPETMFKIDDLVELGPVSPDGKWITMEVRGGSLAMAPFVAGGQVQRLTGIGTNVEAPAFSPDGRWLAYEASDTVVSQVFVRPFPDIDGGKWQISTSGGVDPSWSRDGRELFFLDVGTSGSARPSALMSAAVSPGPTFIAAPATVALKYPPSAARGFAQGVDGRFLFVFPASSVDDEAASRPRIVVVQHWTAELERLVPVK